MQLFAAFLVHIAIFVFCKFEILYFSLCPSVKLPSLNRDGIIMISVAFSSAYDIMIIVMCFSVHT